MKAAATALLMFILANAEVLASPGSSCAPQFIEVDINEQYRFDGEDYYQAEGDSAGIRVSDEAGVLINIREIETMYGGFKTVDGVEVSGVFAELYGGAVWFRLGPSRIPSFFT